MAIVSKTNRDGIDIVIENLQQKFYASLLAYWQTGITYQMYPRANKNYRDDQILPEISLDEKDYSDALTNDKFDITSFFIIDNEREFEDNNKLIRQNISLIFQADLVEIYGINERADEIFKMDVLRVVTNENFYVYDNIRMIEGIDRVYEDLTITGEMKRMINVTDISNLHVLRCDFTVLYKPDCNQTLPPLCAGVSISVNGVFSEVKPAGSSYDCVSAPVSVTFNTVPVFSTPSGETKAVTAVDSVGAPVGTKTTDTAGALGITISNALNFFNGNPIAGVKAEGNKTFSFFNSLGTPLGVVVADSVDEFEAEAEDIIVTDSDGSVNFWPAGENVVCTPMIPSGMPVKTGQVTSITISGNDDGGTQFGDGVDFYTLSHNNPFGNNKAFTGRTGGYEYPAGSYFDKDGNATTLALAFPDDVVCNWKQWNPVTKKFLMWQKVREAATSWTNTMDIASPFTFAGYSNWYAPNKNQFDPMMNCELAQAFDYPPFNIQVTAAGNNIWLSTYAPNAPTLALAFNGVLIYQARTLATNCQRLYVRIANESDII